MDRRDALAALAGAPMANLAGAATPNDEPARLALSFRAGDRYFSRQGRPVLVLGRNPWGRNPDEYIELFRRTASAGEGLVRIHFTWPIADQTPGEVHPRVLAGWERMLDHAQSQGLAVLPVLGLWAFWSDGSTNPHWHAWDRNPFNAARGGPARRPIELFEDTETRRLWLRRAETLVRRWAARPAIVAWELFSEVDLVAGSTPAKAAQFVALAAAVVRAADASKRPVTVSLSGVVEWPEVLRSEAIDFNQIHPYAGGRFRGRLDELILDTTRDRLAKYGKPVLVGECGLDFGRPLGPSLDAAPRAALGIRHAIWSAIVSGSMTGRMLWWQDGYDASEGADLQGRFHDIAVPAAAFVRDIDFGGFAPVACRVGTRFLGAPRLFGAALGHHRLVLAWFRDAACVAPDWPVTTVSEASVAIELAKGRWKVSFVDPATGGEPAVVRELDAVDARTEIALPAFQDAIALRMDRID